MAIPLVVNGVTFQYPVQFDKNWGPTLTTWSQAVTNGMLQKAGGSFPLTAEVDFGGSFGMKVLSIKTEESNIAASGFLRLANASSGLVWRNAANNADLALTVNSSNQLTFNGTNVGATTSLTNGHILVGNVSNQPADVAMTGDVSITNAGVTTVAGLTGKLNLSGGTMTGQLTLISGLSSAPSLVLGGTTTGFYSAGAGQIQMVSGGNQMLSTDGTNVFLSVPTSLQSNKIINLANGSAATDAAAFGQVSVKVAKSGDTMSGVLNMGNNKIQGLTQGSNSGEAIAWPITTAILPAVTQTATSASGTGSDLTSITTASLTTTGGKVLVFFSATVSGKFTGLSAGVSGFAASVTVQRDGTPLSGGTAAGSMVVANAAVSGSLVSNSLPLSGVVVDSPSAGAHTYTLLYSVTGASTAVSSYDLSAVELKI